MRHDAVHLSLALLLLACGGASSVAQRTTPTRPRAELMAADGVVLEEIALPASARRRVRRSDARLWVSQSDLPRAVTGEGVVALDGTEGFVPLPFSGSIGGAVSLIDGSALVSTGSDVLRLVGPDIVGGRRVVPGERAILAPAAATVVYLAAEDVLYVLTSRGERRAVQRFVAPIAAVAGTGDLTFVATADRWLWALRLGRPPTQVLRHPHPIESLAIDPSGFLLLGDEHAVYAVRERRASPLLYGFHHPQLAAGMDATYVFSATEGRILRLGSVALAGAR